MRRHTEIAIGLILLLPAAYLLAGAGSLLWRALGHGYQDSPASTYALFGGLMLVAALLSLGLSIRFLRR